MVVFAAVVQAAGCWLRVLGSWLPFGRFACSLLGQAVAATAAPLLLSAPSALSVRWFAPHERGMSLARAAAVAEAHVTDRRPTRCRLGLFAAFSLVRDSCGRGAIADSDRAWCFHR